ncbi:MAG: hypothetical protein Q9164_004344 [Protoblastenia rupestris]
MALFDTLTLPVPDLEDQLCEIQPSSRPEVSSELGLYPWECSDWAAHDDEYNLLHGLSEEEYIVSSSQIPCHVDAESRENNLLLDQANQCLSWEHRHIVDGDVTLDSIILNQELDDFYNGASLTQASIVRVNHSKSLHNEDIAIMHRMMASELPSKSSRDDDIAVTRDEQNLVPLQQYPITNESPSSCGSPRYESGVQTAPPTGATSSRAISGKSNSHQPEKDFSMHIPSPAVFDPQDTSSQDYLEPNGGLVLDTSDCEKYGIPGAPYNRKVYPNNGVRLLAHTSESPRNTEAWTKTKNSGIQDKTSSTLDNVPPENMSVGANLSHPSIRNVVERVNGGTSDRREGSSPSSSLRSVPGQVLLATPPRETDILKRDLSRQEKGPGQSSCIYSKGPKTMIQITNAQQNWLSSRRPTRAHDARQLNSQDPTSLIPSPIINQQVRSIPTDLGGSPERGEIMLRIGLDKATYRNSTNEVRLAHSRAEDNETSHTALNTMRTYQSSTITSEADPDQAIASPSSAAIHTPPLDRVQHEADLDEMQHEDYNKEDKVFLLTPISAEQDCELPTTNHTPTRPDNGATDPLQTYIPALIHLPTVSGTPILVPTAGKTSKSKFISPRLQHTLTPETELETVIEAISERPKIVAAYILPKDTDEGQKNKQAHADGMLTSYQSREGSSTRNNSQVAEAVVIPAQRRETKKSKIEDLDALHSVSKSISSLPECGAVNHVDMVNRGSSPKILGSKKGPGKRDSKINAGTQQWKPQKKSRRSGQSCRGLTR